MEIKKSKKFKKRYVFYFLMVGVVFFVCLNIPFDRIHSFSNNCFITSQELVEIENSKFFGPFISVKIKEKSVKVSKNQKVSALKEVFDPEIQFKLFNLIPIKTQKIKIIKDDKVLLGGAAVGLVLKTEGVLVVGSSPVPTLDGDYDMLEKDLLQVGDILTQIENETIEGVSSISKIINKEENKNRELLVKGIRKNKDFLVRLKPCYDIKSENFKLGVWVRDDASGIGTLTYINPSNRFGALGHPICDSDTKTIISLKDGKVYNCSILGVNKGISGNPGEIRGLFMQGKNEQGVIEKNNEYGVFGEINKDSPLLKGLEQIDVGSRLSVKPGKAQIRCCIEGNKVESFNVEIIKTNFQNYSNDKSIVIRVVDKDLLARTGGIVQGMSGSPILQNGKLVGAVTHVFVNDPSKGFGVYIDWMLNE